MSAASFETVSAADTADAISERMSTLRGSLGTDVEHFKDGVRQATDVRAQIDAHPYVAGGLVAAAAYLLIPRRPTIVQPSADAIAKLAEKEKLVVTSKPTAEATNGLLAAGLAIGANFALRAATAYLGQKAGKVFTDAATTTDRATQ